MLKPDDIVNEAKKWIGVKFRHCGRNKNGVDCIGLIIKVAHELDLSQYDTNSYARRPHVAEFLRGFKTHMDPICKSHMTHGDVLLTKATRFPVHCGILEVDEYGQKWFIHSSEPYGGVVREALSEQRMKDVIHVFRYRLV